MKQSRFYISLYIIIPFIFTGFTIFAALVSFRITKYVLVRGLDPVAYATEFAEGELGAAKDYAEKVRQLAGGESLNPNEKSRRILNTQMLKIINDWRIFLERIRYMANQSVFEQTECRVLN